MSFIFVITNKDSCEDNLCTIDTEFNPSLQLDRNKSYEMALVNLETYWSFPNITEKNNQFKFSDGKNNREILIQKGAYELSEINKYIQKEIVEYGYPKDSMKISANRTTLKAVLEIKKGFVVAFTEPNSIASVLGFDKKLYVAATEDQVFQGQNIVKIININSIYVHNNLISHSYIDGSLNPVIYSFFPKTSPGEKIIQEPKNMVYSPVTLDTITSMETWLTDQDNNDLDLQGENLTIRFHLREVANSKC